MTGVQTCALPICAEDGVDDVTLYVFDDWSVGDKSYQERYQHYQRRIKAFNNGSIVALEHNMLHTIDEVSIVLDKEKKRNGEGIILRLPSAKWKNGRSTPKSQESVKLKFFEQQEYKIVDVVERMHNTNEAKVNELGYTERSSNKDNMIPMNTFGAFVMELQDGRTFNVGPVLAHTTSNISVIFFNLVLDFSHRAVEHGFTDLDVMHSAFQRPYVFAEIGHLSVQNSKLSGQSPNG